jgi:hypothetical protein
MDEELGAVRVFAFVYDGDIIMMLGDGTMYICMQCKIMQCSVPMLNSPAVVQSSSSSLSS